MSLNKRHVVKNLKLREISSVDRPAQVGAVSVLMKRATLPEHDLAKATFQEALEGQVMASRVNDAFYNSFNGLWERNDAFRTALTDELAAGGDGTVASADYVKSVEGLVERAVAAARDAGANADTDTLEKAFNKAAGEWLADQETDMTIKTKAALGTAIEKALAAGAALTVADVTMIHKAAEELKAEDMLPVEGPLAKAAPAADPALVARLDRIDKRDALSTAERAHYDTLTTDTDRDAFLGKSADERIAILNKGAGDDPVVYTTLDGIDIRKSAGDTAVALAKSNDDLRRRLAKSEAASETVTLEKRANDLLGNVGGELTGKTALLKALDTITDTATRDAAEAVLKAANEAGKGIFKRQGATGEGAAPAGEANAEGYEPSDEEQQLEDMAKAYAKEHDVTFEKAYTAVIQTTEGATLYKRFTEAK